MPIQLAQQKEDLTKLRKKLVSKPRDFLLFELLLQKNSKTNEIISLSVKDLVGCKISEPIKLGNKATKVVLTQAGQTVFDQLMIQDNLSAEDFIFRSRKGNSVLTKTSVSRLIRSYLKEADLCHYKGISELRKNLSSLIVNDTVPFGADVGSSKLNTISRVSIQQLVYTELLQKIISGKLEPSSRISLEKIAEQMGVSSTPIREALRRLEAKGFVINDPQKGWLISAISPQKLKEILDLRLLLECEAIYQAATKITDKTIYELEIAQRDYEIINSQQDPIATLEANRRFHMLAYRDAGSEKMQEIISELWDLASPYNQILFRQSELKKLDTGIDHHNKIVEALRARDAEKAKECLEADIKGPVDFIFKLFDIYMMSK